MAETNEKSVVWRMEINFIMFFEVLHFLEGGSCNDEGGNWIQKLETRAQKLVSGAGTPMGGGAGTRALPPFCLDTQWGQWTQYINRSAPCLLAHQGVLVGGL